MGNKHQNSSHSNSLNNQTESLTNISCYSINFDYNNIADWLQQNGFPLATQNALKVFNVECLKDLTKKSSSQIETICKYLNNWPEFKGNRELQRSFKNAIKELKREAKGKKKEQIKSNKAIDTEKPKESNDEISIFDIGGERSKVKRKKRPKCGHCSHGKHSCGECNGLGYKGEIHPKSCIKCHATGQVQCEKCGGSGYM